ncbi:glycine, alanine and asparagine-rich protein-like [Accipiter gentilis]|uniref:glycine, alanine and asparagine-rich protein-like n=1 Tax=Astur gentilis TaxID=8957 RepID=UPI00210F99F5|nr:glycine, alanine and asparagine-rich protein-like [Accipiter gentilis]
MVSHAWGGPSFGGGSPTSEGSHPPALSPTGRTRGSTAPPPPLPPVTVTSFSGTIRLYSSAVGGSPAGKPLLLLLPWLGARARGLARYLALYLRRGVDVLVVGTTACHVLRPRQGQRLAGRLLRLLDHGGDGDGGEGGSGGVGGDGGGGGGGGDGSGYGDSGGAGGTGGGHCGGNGGDAGGGGGAGGGNGGVGGGNGGSGAIDVSGGPGDTGGGGGGSGLATRPLLVHAISAGAYTFAQVLLLLRHRPRQCRRLAPRFRGIVYDSLVTGGIGDMARGIAGAVGTPYLRALVRAGARLYLGVLGCWGGREFERARGAFASPPLRCPLLLFYSLDDGLCQPAVLRALLRGWRAQGIRAHARGWPRSRHAAHLRQHPAEYRQALLAFLRSLEGPPKARL